jgi:hypothetical protein
VVNGTNGNGTVIVPPINNTGGNVTQPCDIIVGEGGTEEKPIVDEILPEIDDGSNICITDTDPSS